MERRAVGVWVVEDRGEDGRAGGLRHHAADLGLQMEQGDRDSGILFPLVPGARIRDWRAVLDGREQARLRSSRWHLARTRTSATMREARPPRKDLSHFSEPEGHDAPCFSRSPEISSYGSQNGIHVLAAWDTSAGSGSSFVQNPFGV